MDCEANFWHSAELRRTSQSSGINGKAVKHGKAIPKRLSRSIQHFFSFGWCLEYMFVPYIQHMSVKKNINSASTSHRRNRTFFRADLDQICTTWCWNPVYYVYMCKTIIWHLLTWFNMAYMMNWYNMDQYGMIMCVYVHTCMRFLHFC